jgi:hypothetical protein
VAGSTQSDGFPATPPLRGPSDAFVARLGATGSLTSAQFLGGSGAEAPTRSRSTRTGHVVACRPHRLRRLPAPANTKGAGLDAFVTQLGGTIAASSAAAGATRRTASRSIRTATRTWPARPTARSPRRARIRPATTASWPSSRSARRRAGADRHAGSDPARAAARPPPRPETTINGRPPAQTPDQVVQFASPGRCPARSTRAPGLSFGCRVDGGAFVACASPYTTKKLALAEHTFEVRA